MNEDQHHLLNLSTPNLQASSSSSFSCHIFFDSPREDQSGYLHPELQKQEEVNNLASRDVSYGVENESDNCLKLSLWKKEYTNENQMSEKKISVKWMSSKMRLMKKMKNSDQTTPIPTHNFQDHKQLPSPLEAENSSNSSSNHINIPIRVCADCNTTKTPLWRSGPRGPKSLCNACGIRQRKARRAMAAAAANGTFAATEASSTKAHKDKRSSNNKGLVAKYKKRSKLAIVPSDHGCRKKHCFEDFLISLSKNLAFHSVFPQDEKEAAILLMALSCGLVHD